MSPTPDQLVNREVRYCVSYLVSTLAGAYGAAVTHVDSLGRRSTNGSDLAELLEQAFELATPIDDWEEAARQAGWTIRPETVSAAGVQSDPCVVRGPTNEDPEHAFGFKYTEDWQAACESDNLEPYQWEVYEHWIVSDWLADRLEAHGEKVDRDFAGMTVWARTCTGQAIASDSVIETICAELSAA